MGTTPLRIAIAGLGVVGSAVVRLLEGWEGSPVTIVAVCARRRDRDMNIAHYTWYSDALDMAQNGDYDVFVELIGGVEPARVALWEAVFARGKALVTANKALLAAQGEPLALRAEKQGAALLAEAAVAGGIPALKLVREGLAACRKVRVVGILNGTCNYILTRMGATGEDFATVLAQAQALGYAEADPKADVGGFDAADKLVILIRLAFGVHFEESDLPVRGIEDVRDVDMRHAHELGYAVKLIAEAEVTDGRLRCRVEPALIPAEAPLAKVSGVTNALQVESHGVESVMISGPGAGGDATATAVVADLMDIYHDRASEIFGRLVQNLSPIDCIEARCDRDRFYIRLRVRDQAGVIGQLGVLLAAHAISIESIVQRHDEGAEASAETGNVGIVILTHTCAYADLRSALAEMSTQDYVTDSPFHLRIDTMTAERKT